MGYGRRRLLVEIEVPLALPGDPRRRPDRRSDDRRPRHRDRPDRPGGVGFFILSGLNRFFNTEIVVGTALSVLIAVGIDLAVVSWAGCWHRANRRRPATPIRVLGDLLRWFVEDWDGDTGYLARIRGHVTVSAAAHIAAIGVASPWARGSPHRSAADSPRCRW